MERYYYSPPWINGHQNRKRITTNTKWLYNNIMTAAECLEAGPGHASVWSLMSNGVGLF
jgi:hypothetical protein